MREREREQEEWDGRETKHVKRKEWSIKEKERRL